MLMLFFAEYWIWGLFLLPLVIGSLVLDGPSSESGAEVIWSLLAIVALYFVFNGTTLGPLVTGEFWLTVAKWTGFYLLVGLCWSFGKWIHWLSKLDNQIQVALNDKSLPGKDKVLSEINSYRTGNRENVEYNGVMYNLIDRLKYIPNPIRLKFEAPTWSVIPSAKHNMDHLVAWLTGWPVSMLNVLLKDFLNWLVKLPVRLCRHIYDHVAKSMVKEL